MFTLPSPPPPGDAPLGDDDGCYVKGLPFVQLVEDSHTIQHMLQCCYPGADLALLNYADLGSLADASCKYEMPAAISAVKRAVLSKGERDPLPAFAFACGYAWADTARGAARLWLCHPVPNWPPYPPELKALSADVFCRLVAYRNKCSKAAVDTLCSLDWLKTERGMDEMTVSCAQCCSTTSAVSFSSGDLHGGYVTQYRVARWYERYILRLLPVVRGTPWGALALHPSVVRPPPDTGVCAKCKDQTERVCYVAKRAIERTIDKVGRNASAGLQASN